MATIEKRRGGYRLVFWYKSKRYQGAIKADDLKQAENIKARVEENLGLLQQGRLEYRPGGDLFMLMLSDGKLNAPVAVTERLTLGGFLKRYKDSRPPGKEQNTAYTENIHVGHLLRLLSESMTLADVPARLQDYITARAKETGRRGEPVSHVTIRKELGTLTSIWNKWGMRNGLVQNQLSIRNLDYDKSKEKPPFQTWEQIEARIAQGATEELWDSLYLALPEIEALLGHVKKSKFPWVYPMFVFCAHTGSRRSEMLRSERQDFDFDAGQVTIREKKKDRSKKETYRHVPMTDLLMKTMKNWFKAHPGGKYAFCQLADQPITFQMANHYLRWTLDGSKWGVIRGWHCLRHSYVSNLASQGVDERVIMRLVGHLNPETTRRYQHLFPSTIHDAVRLVFGNGKGAKVLKPN